ncbi:MAG: hypothetical protein D6678_07960 [Zetaproteobacteria bacterium]|nr:MAG: hypothetical protein D6678_07960 [Zetaproteobacteria bacterium]
MIQPRHLGLAGLVVLSFAYMALFRYDRLGIEEGAAQALLLNWSIVQQIASPVALYGMPDLRAIFFVPLDMHWAGSLVAAKVFTLLTLFGTALMLYRWAERVYSSESAMISTALLLIAPISAMQVDALGSGVFLLFCLVAACWLNEIMRNAKHALPSWFFLLIITCAMAVSLHPMGLAIPAVLLWQWWRADAWQQARGKFLGLLLATVVICYIRWGWYGMEAGADNPLVMLGDALLGSPLLRSPGWGTGLILFDLLLITAGVHLWRKCADPLALMLMLASAIGLLAANHSWAFLSWTAILLLGIPLLIEANTRWGWRSLLGQRGVLLLVVCVVATISMNADRNLARVSALHLKNNTDMVIAVLAQEAADASKPFIAASEWPARTLLACRRDVLPLPPVNKDLATFRKQISGLTHLAFDPRAPRNHDLTRAMAALSHEWETIALLPGGVVLKDKHPHQAQ